MGRTAWLPWILMIKMLNQELFKIIMKWKARRHTRDLGGFITCEPISEDMVEAARNPKIVRYPGYLDAPERQKQDTKISKPVDYI